MIDRRRIRTFIDTHLIKTGRNINYKDTDDLFQLKLVNSLFAMRLLKFLEDEFRVNFTEQDLEFTNFSTIDNIVNFLNKKLFVSI